MPVRVVTDSTCDLPTETISRYNIHVIPLYINIGKQEFLDGVDITREEFYKALPTYAHHPTTAAPSPLKFKAVYDSLADEGASDILSIHVSESLSAVVNEARVAARDTVSAAVRVIDGRQLSMGTGFLVETAAKLAQLGSSVDDILHALGDQVRRTYTVAMLDTLDYLRRSGRMHAYMASIGSLLQIKPILKMHDGKPENERVRTRDHALKRVIEMLAALGPLERVALLHTNARERVAELREKAAHLLPSGNLITEDITPVIGAHIGPGAVGFAAVTASE